MASQEWLLGNERSPALQDDLQVRNLDFHGLKNVFDMLKARSGWRVVLGRVSTSIGHAINTNALLRLLLMMMMIWCGAESLCGAIGRDVHRERARAVSRTLAHGQPIY